MKAGLTQQLRALLREHPDGLSTTDLATRLSRTNNNVRNALMRMPDVSIDRWERPSGKGQYVAVWCAVVPPPNCPHPTRRVE